MKICSICNLEKDEVDFYKRKSSKDGLRKDCKDCCYNRNKKWISNNIEIVKSIKDKYYKNNKQDVIERSYEWSKNNKDKRSEILKKYNSKEEVIERVKNRYLKNKYNITIKRKKYKFENREKLNQNLRYKYHNDYEYRFKVLVKNLITKSFKRCGYTKISKTYDILGCSFEEFKAYLESKFEDWMSWDNRGLYNGELNYGWDIDHIIPLSSAINIDEVLKLNHYTNLQPLCSKVNRDIKKDKLNY